MTTERPAAALWRTLQFVAHHPLVQSRRSEAALRWLRWQVGSRVLPGVVAVPFVDETRLLVRRGMTGATGNIYVGLAEFEEMAFTMHFLRKGDLFADVGANVGVYSIIASGVCGARTIAFEPVPATFSALRDNVVLNGLDDLVETRREAVGASMGHVTFTQTFDTTNHVALAGENGVDVPATTLDAAMSEMTPTFIKVDTEGYEAFVVQGAQKTLALRGVRGVMLELGGAGERYGREEREIAARMTELGFSPIAYEPLTRVVTRKSAHDRGNVLFVRDIEEARSRAASAPRRRVLDTLV